jgi:hypothetical protein
VIRRADNVSDRGRYLDGLPFEVRHAREAHAPKAGAGHHAVADPHSLDGDHAPARLHPRPGDEAVIVLIGQNRKYLARGRVCLPRVKRKLLGDVFAPWVDDHVEAAQELDAVLDRARPLDRAHDLEPVPLHVADRLGPGTVGRDGPPERALDTRALARVGPGQGLVVGRAVASEQGRRVVYLAADLVGLGVDEQRAALGVGNRPVAIPAADEGPHQDARVDGEAPVGPEAEHGVGGGFEVGLAPVAEHAGFAVAAVLTKPDVRVALWITPPVELHLLLQHVRKERVVSVVDLADDAARRRPSLAAEHRVDRVVGVFRVPLDPQLGTGLTNGWDQQIPRPLRDLVRLHDDGEVQALRRLDRVGVGPQPVE